MALEATSVLALVGALLVILFSCEVFTNGIEWLGCRLGVSETATGSILAAVGTAMPETVVPIIAIFLGSEAEGEEIGEGAILGAPFMLGTLAMFVGGIAVYLAYRKGRRGPKLTLLKGHMERDLRFFMIAYSLALLTGLLGAQDEVDLRIVNYFVALVLIFIYVTYVRRTLRDEHYIEESTCPVLYMTRLTKIPNVGKSGLAMISFQVVAALFGIIVGAKFFVDGVEHLSDALSIPAMVLAFLVAPIATELPEKFNSFIWYWRSKDVLALGNITGAMVFQSSIPVTIGLLFTSWVLAPINIASIVIALTAAAWIYLCVRRSKGIHYRTLLASGSLYILYILLLFVVGAS